MCQCGIFEPVLFENLFLKELIREVADFELKKFLDLLQKKKIISHQC